METTTKVISIDMSAPASVQAEVCKLLEWDDLAYGEMQFETGIAYLEYYIPNDPDGRNMLTRSKTFWAWWKNHWLQRDKAFLIRMTMAEGPVALHLIQNHYECLHNPRKLARAIWPSGIVLDMSYSEMIQDLFDNEIHSR